MQASGLIRGHKGVVMGEGGKWCGQGAALVGGALSLRLSSGFMCFMMIHRLCLCWFE